MTDVIDPVEVMAFAIFRAGFHPDEDAALVLEKWNEWATERDQARKRARTALTAAEAAGMVWVKRDDLIRAHQWLLAPSSFAEAECARVIIAALLCPEQATREGDATP